MFKLALSPTFWATCKVEFVDENGARKTGSFGVQYARHDREQLDVINAEIKEAVSSGSVTNYDSEFCRRIVKGFREFEVIDPRNGETIAAGETEKMLEFLLTFGFGVALVKTFYEDYPKARAKN